MRFGADSLTPTVTVPLTLIFVDLLNPKSEGCDAVSRTTNVKFQVIHMRIYLKFPAKRKLMLS